MGFLWLLKWLGHNKCQRGMVCQMFKQSMQHGKWIDKGKNKHELDSHQNTWLKTLKGDCLKKIQIKAM